MFLRFTSKQTYRILLFFYIVFATQQSLRSWYLLSKMKSGSRKISILLFFEDFCLSLSWKYRFSQNVNHAKVQSKANNYCKFHVDPTRTRLSKRRYKKWAMVPKKLYRNTSNKSPPSLQILVTWSAVCQNLLPSHRHIESRWDPGDEVRANVAEAFELVTCDRAFFLMPFFEDATVFRAR